ncbi:MAG: T9SS type A sorting domain-containing protein [Bacteroidales bacterium]|nr:T9SS type A sorting domain-containing protein [Bacteroidales bacterium]
MKKIITTILLMAWGISSFAQGIFNDGAYIVSETGSYWVVDNGDFTLTSLSASNLVQTAHLTIMDDASLTLPSGSYLTVNSTLYNQGSFNIQSGSSLITNGTITNNGTISVQKSVDKDNQWHLISVPNAVSTANTFIGDYLIPWNEQTASWTNINDPETVLIPVKGYNLKVKNSEGNYSFSGMPNTGNQNIAICYTENGTGYKGANLVGNPYPSAIDWADLDNTYGAVYLWDGTQYATWNDGSSVNGATQYIPPMQGFFIVTNSSGTFSLTNDNKTHSGASSFYKEAKSIQNGLILYASNGSYSDELCLVFDEHASANFELQRDAYKLASSTSGIAQLYSFSGDTKFSIDVRPEESTIQLGFTNDINGVYEIALKEMNGLLGAFLEDTKENIFHNLQSGAYSFVWNSNDSEKRFKFNLSTTGIEDTKAELASIFAFQKTLYIKSNTQLSNASVQMIDMTGKVVYQNDLNQSHDFALDLSLANGIYTVILTTEKESQVQKIILN